MAAGLSLCDAVSLLHMSFSQMFPKRQARTWLLLLSLKPQRVLGSSSRPLSSSPQFSRDPSYWLKPSSVQTPGEIKKHARLQTDCKFYSHLLHHGNTWRIHWGLRANVYSSIGASLQKTNVLNKHSFASQPPEFQYLDKKKCLLLSYNIYIQSCPTKELNNKYAELTSVFML